MTPAVHELRWWTRGELEAIAAAMAGAWMAWSQDWLGVACPRGAVRAGLAHETALKSEPWRPWSEEQHGAWIAGEEAFPAALSRLMFAGQHAVSGSVAESLARQAGAAARQAIGRTLKLHTTPGAAQALFEPWSGGVVVDLPAGNGSVRLLLDGATACAMAGPQATQPRPLPGLAAVDAAAASKRARVTVELRESRVGLGELQGLSIGDVIRFDHALSRPLVVCLDDAPVAQGHLGRRGIAKAVALLPPGGDSTWMNA